MRYISRCVEPLRYSVIREMVARAAAYTDVIPLSIGEPDFNTPQDVCKKAGEDAFRGFTHYAPSTGDPELRAALLKKINDETRLNYKGENLLITSGAMHGLAIAMRTLLDAGDEVICPAPCFSDYIGHCSLSGGKLVFVPTKMENAFEPSREDMERAFTPKSKVLLINSPCNPTGAILSPKTLDMLADFAKEHDLTVISDEVYNTLYFSEKPESIGSRQNMQERTLVLNSFSKAYAMTGWRIGYAYGPEWILKEMVKPFSYTASCSSTIGQRAAFYALTGDQEPYENFRKEFQKRSEYASARLNDMPGVQCFPAKGTFYLFPKFQGVTDTKAFAIELLDKEKIVLVPGFPFGPQESVEGCLRIACTVPMDKLIQAMDRLEHFIKSRA